MAVFGKKKKKAPFAVPRLIKNREHEGVRLSAERQVLSSGCCCSLHQERARGQKTSISLALLTGSSWTQLSSGALGAHGVQRGVCCCWW